MSKNLHIWTISRAILIVNVFRHCFVEDIQENRRRSAGDNYGSNAINK
jgi:hypothetical protein